MSSNICSGERPRVCPMAESLEERGGTSNKERHQEMTSSLSGKLVSILRVECLVPAYCTPDLPASRNMDYSPRIQYYLSRPQKIDRAFFLIYICQLLDNHCQRFLFSAMQCTNTVHGCQLSLMWAIDAQMDKRSWGDFSVISTFDQMDHALRVQVYL